MLELEEIKKQLMKGKTIESILGQSDWKNFEAIIAKVFEENNFHTILNFRFKTKNRFEIDIIAIKGNDVFCVDCKWWNTGRYKKTRLKNAITKQEKRLKEFRKFIKKNLIAKKTMKIDQDSNFYTLIVTLLEEDLLKENETIVVPAWKLNAFLMDIDSYIE